MANANDPLLDGDNLLIAVDFVTYFMRKTKPDLTNIFEDSSINIRDRSHRKNEHLDVREDMQNVLKCFDETESKFVRGEFEKFRNNLAGEEELKKFSYHCNVIYRKEGISITNFSKYCARIAAMASYFYDRGMMHAPDVAVKLILDSFENDDPNLNWTYHDFATQEEKMITQESPDFVTIREQARIISSETEESSNDDSMQICGSDSNSNDQFQQSSGYIGKQSIVLVTPDVKVQSVSAKVGELTISDLEHTRAVTEQTGGCSSLSPVPVTRSSSVSPRRIALPKAGSSPSPLKRHSGEFSKRSSSLGKRRSTGSDDSVSLNVAESAAERDATAEEVFSPSEPKKSKIGDVDESK